MRDSMLPARYEKGIIPFFKRFFAAWGITRRLNVTIGDRGQLCFKLWGDIEITTSGAIDIVSAELNLDTPPWTGRHKVRLNSRYARQVRFSPSSVDWRERELSSLRAREIAAQSMSVSTLPADTTNTEAVTAHVKQVAPKCSCGDGFDLPDGSACQSCADEE